MTLQTENTIQQLNGLKLIKTSRSANMECLKFGHKTNVKNQNIGEFGLHIQADWRIINEVKILVASNDLFEPDSKNQAETNFNYEEGNLRDEKLKNIIDSNDLIVSKVFIDKIGGLNIRFCNKMELQIIPTNSSESEYNEFWRLIDNRKEKSKHIVAKINGIEIE
jgi:hypothetical protein